MVDAQLTGDARDQAEWLLDNLLDEIADQLKSGSDVDLSLYVSRYPQHAEQLQEALPGLRAFVKLGHSLAADDAGAADQQNSELSHTNGVLGDFRILHEIGRGGMGIVYEAEQISLDRRIALKVLPFAAMLDERQLARFKNEARAAASLKHPHIVGVYSVGCERGVHYYAMELVAGLDVAQVIARMRPSHEKLPESSPAVAPGVSSSSVPPESGPKSDMDSPPQTSSSPETQASLETLAVARLSTVRQADIKQYFRSVARLVVQAAEALEYAHQTGVIHRDIKPSNLLVDQFGKLWITDFGLAQIHGAHQLTMTGEVLGTLRYMSPELAQGSRALVDHRTDIYSLGITLYELLTLEAAFDGEERQALLRDIIEQEPRPLSQVNRRVPRDLETIVLKAISKEQEHRYQTAQQLADDLNRFLEDRSITARRPSATQRLAKWVRRHVALVTAALVFSLLSTILLGIGMAVISRARSQTALALDDAQDSLQFARLTVDQMYTQLAMDWLADDLDVTPTQQGFLEKALRIYGHLAGEARGDPQSQWEAGTSYSRIARIQHKLGQYRQAQSAYERSIEIHQSLVEEFSDRPDYLAELAATYMDLGTLHEAKEQLPEAWIAWNSARGLLEQLTEDFPEEPAYREVLATGDQHRARHLLRIGKDSQAELLARAACETLGKLHQEQLPSVKSSLGLTRGQLLLARVLRVQGNFDEAGKLSREAVDRCARLAGDLTDSRPLRRTQAAALTELADVLVATDRMEEALATLRTALDIAQQALRIGTSPHAFMTRWFSTGEWAKYAEPEPFCDYVEIRIRLGSVLGQLGHTYEAQQTLAEAVRVAGVLRQVYPHPRHAVAEANAYACLAKVLQRQQHADADAVAALAAQDWHFLVEHFPSTTSYCSGLHAEGDLDWFTGNFPEQQPVEAPRKSIKQADLLSLQITLGVAWYRHGAYRDAIRCLEKFADTGSGGDSYGWFHLAMAYHEVSDNDEANRRYEQAVRWMDQHKPNSAELLRLRTEAAEVLGQTKSEVAETATNSPRS